MPSVDVAGLVEALAARAHWPYGVVASVMNEAPEVLPDLLHAGVAGLARNSTAIDAMIGLVDVEVLRAEASRGIAVLAEGADPRESQAASLIAYLSLQDPRLLASDLDLLRDLGVNRGTYYESWPWRAATDRVLHERLVRLMGSADGATARRARACLLQARDPGLLRRVAAGRCAWPAAMGTGSARRSLGFDGEFLIRLAPAVTCQLRLPGGFLRPPSAGRGPASRFLAPPGNFPLNLAYRPPSADSPSAHAPGAADSSAGCCTCR